MNQTRPVVEATSTNATNRTTRGLVTCAQCNSLKTATLTLWRTKASLTYCTLTAGGATIREDALLLYGARIRLASITALKDCIRETEASCVWCAHTGGGGLENTFSIELTVSCSPGIILLTIFCDFCPCFNCTFYPFSLFFFFISLSIKSGAHQMKGEGSELCNYWSGFCNSTRA